MGKKQRKLKELAPGGELSLRLSKDIPPEVYEYINIMREEGKGGNKELLQYLVDGVKKEMEPADESVTIHIEGLSREEKKRIESNPEMMALLQNLIKASLNKKREW